MAKKSKKSEKQETHETGVRIELDYRIFYGKRDYQGVVYGSKKLTDALLAKQEELIESMRAE